jgi:hypothetical protein
MQTPPNLNNHHIWGGEQFQEEIPTDVENEQVTLVANGYRGGGFRPFSQAGFIASSSDNLFNPDVDVPSSYVFNLPQISLPSEPRYHAYNRQMDTFPRAPPYISNFSSYNNPAFAVPPPPPHALYDHVNTPPTEPIFDPSGPPPPLPSYNTRPPNTYHSQAQPTYIHQPVHNPQPAYIHQPIHNPQPTYIQPSLPYVHPPPPHTYQPVPFYPIPQYQRVTTPLPSSFSYSKPLPSVTHIPVLTSKHDFSAWDEGVTLLIRANGLIGHILDPSVYVDPCRPDLAPIPLPILSSTSSVRDIEDSNRWWGEDNITQHILISRLGVIPRGLLPTSSLATRTALSIYQLLRQYYGTCNFADCTELLSSLHNSTCVTGRVQEFVSKWRTGLSKLQSANFGFNVKICISLFVRGLPSIPAFNSLRADLPRRIAVIAHDQDYGAFISLTEAVLELDTIFRPTSQSQPPRQPCPSSNVSVPASGLSSSTAPDPSSRTSKKELTCSNCKSRGLRNIGHTDGTCFQPGGGMEGRREEYMSNKGRIHAMLAECLENAFLISDQPLPSDPSSPPTSPPLPPILDDAVLLPPTANLCVSSFLANSDLRDDLYYRCDSKLRFPIAFTSANFQSTALLSMVTLFNALLDSGCTHHIVRDRALFRNYRARSISVGTANCGSLDALGSGDVEFRYPFGDRFIVFTLRGCLHAPSAPINLLSVGALVERGMSCLFSPGGITKVSYPSDHHKFPGFAFSATVSNRLSFLKLDFISPDTPEPLACPATVVPSHPLVPIPSGLPAVASPSHSFPRIKLDSMLWHRRFGHIGMDATRAALTKDYVTGVQLDGSFIRDHCISCIVGKSPQKSYPLRGHRATKIGELLHMDLCGPFPVQGPRGEKYFFNILDDRSNWGFTFGLRLKSDAFSCYRSTEAFLERSNGVVVLNIRCGGELELTAGQMGNHFTSKGIVVQRTVPYAHQQNGKSERYIRTIEEGGQALLADTGLPMSFWLDAVLTRQYLINRLPTSTLSDGLTPFELITNGRKPDLSHLRVWGCDCYVAVPDELRAKAGSKRFRAIFVGYEEHRIGWRVRDLHGKYSFSNDIIFNENLSGRLGISRSPSSSPFIPANSPPSRPTRDQL